MSLNIKTLVVIFAFASIHCNAFAHDIRVGPPQDPNGWAECPVKSVVHEPMRVWSGNKGNLVKITSTDGNYTTMVLKGEAENFQVWKGEDLLSMHHGGLWKGELFDTVISRCLGIPDGKWYAVEHITNKNFLARSADSELGKFDFAWLNNLLNARLAKLQTIAVPSNSSVVVVNWGQMIHPDIELKRQMGVDLATLYHGVVKVDGLYYAIDTAFLAREHEMWRLEAAVKVNAKNDSDAISLANKNRTGCRAYGHFFWNFKPLKSRTEREPTISHVIDSVEYPNISLQLWESVESNDVTRLSSLLKMGANPNFKNERNVSLLGRAATLYACKMGSSKVIDALLEHGADPNQRWGTGNSVTPFWSFVQSVHLHGESDAYKAECISIVRQMLRHGADPNAKYGIRQISSLGGALVWNNSVDLVKVLVEGGAEITDEIIERAKGEIKEYLIGVRNGTIKVIPIETVPHAAAKSKLPMSERARRAKEWIARRKKIRAEKDPKKRKQMINEDLQKFRQYRESLRTRKVIKGEDGEK